jgi:hypothetical protein
MRHVAKFSFSGNCGLSENETRTGLWIGFPSGRISELLKSLAGQIDYCV